MSGQIYVDFLRLFWVLADKSLALAASCCLFQFYPEFVAHSRRLGTRTKLLLNICAASGIASQDESGQPSFEKALLSCFVFHGIETHMHTLTHSHTNTDSHTRTCSNSHSRTHENKHTKTHAYPTKHAYLMRTNTNVRTPHAKI